MRVYAGTVGEAHWRGQDKMGRARTRTKGRVGIETSDEEIGKRARICLLFSTMRPPARIDSAPRVVRILTLAVLFVANFRTPARGYVCGAYSISETRGKPVERETPGRILYGSNLPPDLLSFLHLGARVSFSSKVQRELSMTLIFYNIFLILRY